MTINRNLLKVRIEGALLTYNVYQAPRVGDLVQWDGATDEKLFTVNQVSAYEDGTPFYRIQCASGFVVVSDDEITVSPTVGIERLLTDDLKRTISDAAYKLHHALPRIIRHLQKPPAEATRVQYDDAGEWLKALDNLMRDFPLIAASEYVQGLRHTLHLWMSAVLDAHFPEAKKEGGAADL